MGFSFLKINLNIKKNGVIINTPNSELPQNDLFVL